MFLLKYNSNLSPLSAGTRSRRAPQVSAQLHRSTCGERRGACTGAGRLHVQEGGGPTQTSQARLAQPQEGRQIDNVPCLRTHGRSGGRKRQGSAEVPTTAANPPSGRCARRPRSISVSTAGRKRTPAAHRFSPIEPTFITHATTPETPVKQRAMAECGERSRLARWRTPPSCQRWDRGAPGHTRGFFAGSCPANPNHKHLSQRRAPRHPPSTHTDI